jgi:hypothetical protein
MTTPAKDNKLGAPKINNPQLQAGGGTASDTVAARTVDKFEPVVGEYLRTLYAEEKGIGAQLPGDGSFEGFVEYFMSEEGGAMKVRELSRQAIQGDISLRDTPSTFPSSYSESYTDIVPRVASTARRRIIPNLELLHLIEPQHIPDWQPIVERVQRRCL